MPRCAGWDGAGSGCIAALYLIGVLALLHYFIQSKAMVSEPVMFAGFFVWLMAWRAVPAVWQRNLGALVALGVVAAVATAWIEFGWYAVTTGINPWRVLAANETARFGLRPAHWVGAGRARRGAAGGSDAGVAQHGDASGGGALTLFRGLRQDHRQDPRLTERAYARDYVHLHCFGDRTQWRNPPTRSAPARGCVA